MELAASYAGRVWRRKSTLLGVATGLVLLVLCLQYNATSFTAKVEDSSASPPKSPLQRTLRHHEDSNDIDRVQFVQSQTLPPPPPPREDPTARVLDAHNFADQPSRDDVAYRKAVVEQVNLGFKAPTSTQSSSGQYNSYDQQGLYQMGIPYVNLDVHKPYVPEHRLVHLDLKGAPPKVGYLKKIFPLVRQLGATGILLEWEDMFPFSGPLAPIAAGNAYSRQDVRDILEAAKGSELEVIPLVQTFGHVEFALKLPEFSGLREVPESPQALCPSLNASLEFIDRLIDQVMEAHRDARFLHIGCDEVWQMGECPRCRPRMRDHLFLAHVARVAERVRQRHRVTPLIWDDMLRHLSQQSLDEFHIGDLVEPMVWVYAEDVYRFVPSMVWDKYAAVFGRVWAASAFKGAFGETLYIPNVKRHLENNVRWLEVMTQEAPKFRHGFRGIAITGWQRYDHFAVLCELLPAAVPSLSVALLATSRGFFNASLRAPLHSALGCSRASRAEPLLSLNSDPYLWDKFGRCFFPGAPFFKLTYRLHAAEQELKEFLDSVQKDKGWLTEYNIQRNFSSPLRVDELMAEHGRVYHTMTSLARAARDALDDVFDAYTIAEWVEQRLYPSIRQLEDLQKDAASLKLRRAWPRRPFPPLQDLRRLGVPMPPDATPAPN